MAESVGTIISYCTNDARFLGKCIEEAKRFSRDILVVVADHFFDGSPENRPSLEMTYQIHSDVRFVEFPYQAHSLYRRFLQVDPCSEEWPIFWAATARYIGYWYLDTACDLILFLDADEIVEGDRFAIWLQQGDVGDVQRLASYLYVLRATLRVTKLMSLSLLVRRAIWNPFLLINRCERLGAYLAYPGKKRDGVLGEDATPFVHHYSWVRSLEECLHKGATWGHARERPWAEIVRDSFQGRTAQLFGLPWSFQEEESAYFDPLAVQLKEPGDYDGTLRGLSHVTRMSWSDLSRREIMALG